MKERLYSLDLLRGLDMLLLVAIGPIVRAADSVWHFAPGFIRQFSHGWECFTLWDIIMPMFIFMCGAAVPYALGRRLVDGRPGRAYWGHVAVRVAMLWALGMVVQGNLLKLDPLQIKVYSNTLQSIAAGYLVAAFVMPMRSVKARVAIPLAMAAAYTAMLALGGDYSEFGNFAQKVDHAVFSAVLPAGNVVVAKPSHYTWVATSLMFGFMTMCGCFATEILRGPGERGRKALLLLAYGVGLEAAGWVSAIWIPVIKPIFTLSFTAQAMGWCVIALAALYALTDILKLRRGLGVVILFGQCALAAYLVGGYFRPIPARGAEILTQGLAGFLNLDKAAMGLVNAVVASALIALALFVWRRARAKR